MSNLQKAQTYIEESFKIEDSTKLTRFEREILGRNLIKCYSIVQYYHIIEQVKNYIGKRVLTNSGFSQKFKIDFKEFEFYEPLGLSYRVHLQSHLFSNSVAVFNDLTIKDTNYDGGGYGVSYYKNAFPIGQLEDNGLSDIYPPLELNLFDKDEISKLIQAKKDLLKQVKDIERSLGSFWNYNL